MTSRSISRRGLLKCAAAATAALPMVNLGRTAARPGSPKYSTRAIDIVRRSLVIDMLAPIDLRTGLMHAGWTQPLSQQLKQDFRSSGLSAIHMSAGIGGPNAFENVLMYLAGWNALVSRNPDLFRGVGSLEDIIAADKSGCVAVVMGLQNSDHFRSADDVNLFFGLGQRCSQLTYNSQNLIGSGSTEREDGGVSDFGAEIIRRMNEVGMLVDVSHSGDRTTLDAIELSKTPIAITHSNCRALNDHPRLKTDEAIRRLAAKDGVMGIAEPAPFVRATEPTTIEHYVDHIDHVVKIAGIDHVGVGSDADLHGYDALPAEMRAKLKASYKASYRVRERNDTEGMNHPLRMYELADVLIRRGYGDAHIEAILGGNFQRLLSAVWPGAAPDPSPTENHPQ